MHRREEHVTEALEQAGAKDVSADFRRGEAIFELAMIRSKRLSKIFRQPAINPERKKAPSENSVDFNRDGDYDLLIIGSGGAAFSALSRPMKTGRKWPW